MGDTSPVSLHGLLYIEEGERHVNLRGASDPIAVYLRCAALLHRSLEKFGHGLTIITNEPALLRTRLEQESIQMEVIETTFARTVPETLSFRSAHRKLDVIAAFGRGEMGGRPGLLDLDMVMLNRFPDMISADSRLIGYDIWHQVAPAYGAERIRDDVARVSGRSAGALQHWWGGKFLVGPRDRFALLSEAVEMLYDRYLEVAPDLHHQGDEMLVTAAIHMLSQDNAAGAGGVIADGGAADVIGRWWSSRTLSRIEPLRQLAARSILHLPADKEILSDLLKTPDLDGAALASDLTRRLRRKTWTRRLAAPLDPLLPGPRKHAPTL